MLRTLIIRVSAHKNGPVWFMGAYMFGYGEIDAINALCASSVRGRFVAVAILASSVKTRAYQERTARFSPNKYNGTATYFAF